MAVRSTKNRYIDYREDAILFRSGASSSFLVCNPTLENLMTHSTLIHDTPATTLYCFKSFIIMLTLHST